MPSKKSQFKQADSIIRYEKIDDDPDWYPARCEKRDIIKEVAVLPHAVIGAAYKCWLAEWTTPPVYWPWRAGRIMGMYKKKHAPRWKLLLVEDVKRYLGPRNCRDIVGMIDAK